jgi:uncharacterized protein
VVYINKRTSEVTLNSTLVTIIIILLFIIYLLFEDKNLEVTYYSIHSDKIPKAFRGTKVVVLADLHNNVFGRNNKKLMDEIHIINPHYILVAGDMVVSREPEKLSIPLHLLSELARDYPIYYGLGNHEQRMVPGGNCYDKKYDEYKDSLEKLGVIFLENNRALIKKDMDTICITGLMIDMDYFNKFKQPKMTTEYIQNLLGNPDKQCYNILIAHNPVYFKEYQEWGADLILSGHIHGGIIRLPGLGGVISPQYKFFPKYDAGRYEEKGKTLLVSRGLGLHTIKVRVANKPELMVFTLDK